MTLDTFDVWNRLVKRAVVKGSKHTVTEFAYNGDGLRTGKASKSSTDNYTAHTTNYLYDGQHVVLEDNGASTTATYIRGLNYITKIGASNNIYYYMYNAHGDVVQVTSGDGTVKNRYEYDPFGETILEIEETGNSIKYSGEFQDSPTGLYYLRARYYEPSAGRFISEDSYRGNMFNPVTLNLFTFCHNDPVNMVDPSGHSPTPQERSDLVQSAYNAYLGGYISGAEYAAYASRTLGITISDPSKKSSSGASGSGTSPTSNSPAAATGTPTVLGSSGAVSTGNFNVTVAGVGIEGIYNVNNRNYAGLREMVYALEFGLGLTAGQAADMLLPLSAQRVIWDEVNRTATVRVTDRQTGNLVSKDYTIDQASEDNGFLVIDGRIMIGVRALAQLAGIENYLDWYNDASGKQIVNLYDEKRVIFADADGVTTTYRGFSADDNAYLTKSDAEVLLGTEYTLTEHARILGYFDASTALTNKYGNNNADYIMANFHPTNAMKNGTVTVIGAVPAAQANDPAQIVRVGEKDFIPLTG